MEGPERSFQLQFPSPCLPPFIFSPFRVLRRLIFDPKRAIVVGLSDGSHGRLLCGWGGAKRKQKINPDKRIPFNARPTTWQQNYIIVEHSKQGLELDGDRLRLGTFAVGLIERVCCFAKKG